MRYRKGHLTMLWRRLRHGRRWRALPANLRRGQIGEWAAERHLRRLGMRFLARNFAGKHGEIDLVFRDEDCLVFVEVKTRGEGSLLRPAAAVDRKKQRRLTRTALAYLRAIRLPEVKVRFDIVEVELEEDEVRAVRHLPNAFPFTPPWRHG